MGEAQQALEIALDPEVGPEDRTLMEMARLLRICAYGSEQVHMVLTDFAARRLADDLDELAQLRVAPPTGDDG